MLYAYFLLKNAKARFISKRGYMLSMEIVNKIITILTKPRWFFSHLKEKGVGQAFGMFAILQAIPSILATLIGVWMSDYTSALLSQLLGIPIQQIQFTAMMFISSIISSYIFGLAFSFVIAGLLYFWISIFGGTANYTKTYQLYVYSKVPHLLLAWIPGIGILAWFYSLALLIIGTSEVHKISQKKAVLIYLIPVGIFLLLVILVLAMFLIMMPTMMPLMKLAMQQSL